MRPTWKISLKKFALKTLPAPGTAPEKLALASLAPILLTLFWCSATPAEAQLEIGETFEVDDGLHLQREPQVEPAVDGGFAVLWSENLTLPFLTPDPTALKVRLFDPAGEPRSGARVLVQAPDGPALPTYRARIGADDDGHLVVSYRDLEEPQTCVRALSLSPTGSLEQDFPLVACNRGGPGLLDSDIAVAPDGGWLTATEVWNGAGRAVDLSGNLFDPDVPRLLSGLEINRGGAAGVGDQLSPTAAAWAGGYIVAWENAAAAGGTGRIELRRFDRNGAPVADQQVAEDLAGPSDRPRIASAEDGGFGLVWQQAALGSADRTRSILRIFDALGEPRTPPLLLAGDDQRWAQSPSLALDSRGNALVTWNRFEPASGLRALEGRFFDRHARPQSPVLELRAPGPAFARAPEAALHDQGAALVVWQDAIGTAGLRARTLQAPKDDEVCVNRGSELLCDTANDGGGFEETLRFGRGIDAGDRPMVGDIDGDGDDDFCLRRKALFLCDADGQGAPSELKIRYGLRSHGALLGDLDGDGDDDPCLRVKRRLVCDLAHDGPPSEYHQRFGTLEEDLILGDIDGNGRDEACLYRRGRFFCDPDQSGPPASFISDPVGSGDGLPLLGDVDGDGRDDLCTLELGGELLCDTKRDGSPPVAMLFDVEPGDLPLMGNIDAF